MVIGLVLWLKFVILILMIYCLFRFIYLYLLIMERFNIINYIKFKINSGSMIEYFISIIYWIPLNLMFLKLYFI